MNRDVMEKHIEAIGIRIAGAFNEGFRAGSGWDHGLELVSFSKCRGCGDAGIGIRGGPGDMHIHCELKRLNNLAEEQISLVNTMAAEINEMKASSTPPPNRPQRDDA